MSDHPESMPTAAEALARLRAGNRRFVAGQLEGGQLIDQVIGRRDRKNLAGNYVLLDCDGTEVLLAHLRQGSVAVASGQNVTQQTVLGAVGNSGNSSEPHLHLHAERGGERGVILNGEAVPMLIDGRYLVRGDRL